eukprot:TRINITY_DN15402_c0_g5_i1.p1 TRINITY_DN15402_c0_g5~~TRINITY_DN15402_c0_g5_i1.p1  ORF type:complete len:827 (-),score=164.62 TRINITY_DN15402_c0_g5_i1:442-2922(-)
MSDREGSPCRIAQLREDIASCQRARSSSRRPRRRPRRSTVAEISPSSVEPTELLVSPASGSVPVYLNAAKSNAEVDALTPRSGTDLSSPAPSKAIVEVAVQTPTSPEDPSLASPPLPLDSPPLLLKDAQLRDPGAGPSEAGAAPSDVILEDVLAIIQQSGEELAEQMAERVQEAGRKFCKESSVLIDEMRLRAAEVLAGAKLMSLRNGRRLPLDFQDDDSDSPQQPRWERRKRRLEKACDSGANASPARAPREHFVRISDDHSNSTYEVKEQFAKCTKDQNELILLDSRKPKTTPFNGVGVEHGQHGGEDMHMRKTQTQAERSQAAAEKLQNDLRHERSADTKKFNHMKGEMRTLMPDVDELVKRAADDESKQGIERFYKTSGTAQKIARSHFFDNLAMAVIGINALWIFIDADYNDAESPLDAAPVFQIVENLFCIFFTAELLIKMLALKQCSFFFSNFWIMFDAVLVSTMVFETWMVPLIMFVQGGGNGVGPNTEFLKSFKLVRLTRAARIVRLLRCVPEFLVLLRALVAGMRAVFFTVVLMVAFSYIFAIFLKQLTDDTASIQDSYFSTVPIGMKNLLVMAAFPDLGDMIDEIASESVLACIIFFLSVLITALAMLNMLIGVLCEVVTMVATVEKEGKNVEFISRQMKTYMDVYDSDGDGSLSKEEFMRLGANEEVIRFLMHIQVDVRNLLQYVDVLYTDDAQFEFKEVVKIIRRVKGSNTCSVQDINDLRAWLSKELRDMKEHVQVIESTQEDTRMEVAEVKGMEEELIHKEMANAQRITQTEALISATAGQFNQNKEDTTKSRSKRVYFNRETKQYRVDLA